MKEHESLLSVVHEQIQLQAYDAAWPGAFALERDRLLTLVERLRSTRGMKGDCTPHAQVSKPARRPAPRALRQPKHGSKWGLALASSGDLADRGLARSIAKFARAMFSSQFPSPPKRALDLTQQSISRDADPRR